MNNIQRNGIMPTQSGMSQDLGAKVEKAVKTISELTALLKESSDTIKRRNTEIKECKEQLQVKETELDEYKKALEARVMEVENKKSEICSLNKKQEQLESEKKQAEEELGRFKMIIDSTTKSLQEINSLIRTIDSSKLSSSASIDLLIDSIKTSIGDLKSQVDDLKQQQLNVKGLEEKQESLIAEKDNEIQRLTEANRKAENELGNANSRIGIAGQTMQKLVSVVSSITGVTFAGEGLDAMVEFLDKNTENIEKQINELKGQNEVIAEKDNEIQRLIKSNEKAENELKNSKFGSSDATRLMKNFVDVIRLITGCKNKDPQKIGTMIDFIHNNIDDAERLIDGWLGDEISKKEKSGLLTSEELAEKKAGSPNMMISATEKALKRFASMLSSITGRTFAGDDFYDIKRFVDDNIENAKTKINKLQEQNGAAKGKPGSVKKGGRSCRTPENGKTIKKVL